ncbi:YfiR family protein [Pseudoduganella sp. UC29_106]|uniref:YfiR family protein n=1 Tax=Pseudoduganella sp. UC29_106 TaxID=3374553 RepID=UPI003757926A
METGLIIRLCCTAILLSGAMVRAEESTPHELQVKATYILNFTRYATWPDNPDPNAPLVLCLAGQNAASVARQLQQRAAGSRPLKLLMIDKPEDADHCNAIYISQSDASQSALLTRLRDQAVLTMGDSATFLGEGGMIHMMQADGGVRFEVNLEATRHSGVTLNPRLLALAERVIGGGK